MMENEPYKKVDPLRKNTLKGPRGVKKKEITYIYSAIFL